VGYIRKHGKKWQARANVPKGRARYRTFNLKADAETWAKAQEIAAERGDALPQAVRLQLKAITVGDLLRRYRDTVTTLKKSAQNETYNINALLKQPFALVSLADITSAPFAEYRDKRLKRFKASTINHELTVLHHAFKLAADEWGIPIERNPLEKVRRPSADPGRTRRLEDGELERLLKATELCRNKLLRPMIEFALQTAMRGGEIQLIRWPHVNWTQSTLHIPVTKTGTPRTIPLTERATEILKAMRIQHYGPFLCSQNGLKLAWRRLTKRAGIIGLNFHDLRHEAITQFFELGLSVPEVALISGHKDYRMLARYTHLTPEHVGTRLRTLLKPTSVES
jgi:integrase